MRKNYTYIAKVANTRNELIESLNVKEPVIIISNSILKEVVEDINNNMKKQKNGKLLRNVGGVAGVLGFLFSMHPIGWLVGGSAVIATGIISSLRNELKNYNLYEGKDNLDRDIWVLISKSKVDFKYDIIKYPPLHKIDTKKIVTKKIKL